jgi:hypothetical protein
MRVRLTVLNAGVDMLLRIVDAQHMPGHNELV